MFHSSVSEFVFLNPRPSWLRPLGWSPWQPLSPAHRCPSAHLQADLLTPAGASSPSWKLGGLWSFACSSPWIWVTSDLLVAARWRQVFEHLNITDPPTTAFTAQTFWVRFWWAALGDGVFSWVHYPQIHLHWDGNIERHAFPFFKLLYFMFKDSTDIPLTCIHPSSRKKRNEVLEILCPTSTPTPPTQ